MFETLRKYLVKVDILGSNIKLYNMNKTGQRSQTLSGGGLSIVVVILSLIFSGYFLSDIFYRRNPKAYQVTQYNDDVASLTFEKDGMFFFIQYFNTLNQSFDMYDEKAIVFEGRVKTVRSGETIATYELRKCDYQTDFKGFEHLFPAQNYEKDINNGAYLCISVMTLNGSKLENTNSQYIPPFSDHGMGSISQDPIYFEVGASRCQNSSLNNNHCLSDDRVSLMIIGSVYKLIFVDNMFDTNNYDKPLSQFVHHIDGQVGPTNFANNFINILNVRFQTHDGLVFDNIDAFDSYQFNDRVEMVSPILEGSPNVGKIFNFQIELQNTPKLYERYYTRLQECLASMGGVVQGLFLFSLTINSFINVITEERNIMQKVFSQFINIRKDSKLCNKGGMI